MEGGHTNKYRKGVYYNVGGTESWWEYSKENKTVSPCPLKPKRTLLSKEEAYKTQQQIRTVHTYFSVKSE